MGARRRVLRETKHLFYTTRRYFKKNGGDTGKFVDSDVSVLGSIIIAFVEYSCVVFMLASFMRFPLANTRSFNVLGDDDSLGTYASTR